MSVSLTRTERIADVLIVCNCGHVNFEHRGPRETGECYGNEVPGLLRRLRRGDRLLLCPCQAFRAATGDEYVRLMCAPDRGRTPTLKPLQ